MSFDLGRVLNEAYTDVSKLLLENGAPLLGAVVGGPPGLAAAGVSILSKVLGIPASDPKAIAAQLIADPEARVKAREAEAENQVLLAQYNLEIYKAEVADRSSARSRESVIVQTTGKSDLNLRVLAWTDTAGFYVASGLLLYLVAFTDNALLTALVGTALGNIASNKSQINSYFFGSSAGSARKDVDLKNLATTVAIQQADNLQQNNPEADKDAKP